MSSLADAIQILHGRDLTSLERHSLTKFQELYEINDSDPLVIVLAMMGANRLTLESAPELLQKKAMELIELHRLTLREQATIIAKELITTLAENIYDSARVQNTWKDRLTEFALVFLVGGLIGGGIGWVVAKAIFTAQASA